METNASIQAIASILSQYYVINEYMQLHAVKQYVNTLSITQCHWAIHDTELFGSVKWFRNYRDWLVGIMVNIYIDHQELQYFNTKQKLNWRQPSQYVCMSEFTYYIHYTPGFKIGKPDSLSRHSAEEKSGMEAYFFDESQLIDLENDDVVKEEDLEDMEVEGINVATCGKKNGLWVVQQKHRLEMLHQPHDC